jgi:hypothetical protein
MIKRKQVRLSYMISDVLYLKYLSKSTRFNFGNIRDKVYLSQVHDLCVIAAATIAP